METLNTAARAAGFAMAADEGGDEGKVVEKPDAIAWRSGEAVLLHENEQKPVKAAPTVTDWVKGVVLGVIGRGAPA
jgi:hypothetical protein